MIGKRQYITLRLREIIFPLIISGGNAAMKYFLNWRNYPLEAISHRMGPFRRSFLWFLCGNGCYCGNASFRNKGAKIRLSEIPPARRPSHCLSGRTYWNKDTLLHHGRGKGIVPFSHRLRPVHILRNDIGISGHFPFHKI